MAETMEKPRLSPEEAKAKKAERRQKQREQNGLRAEKMHKARLAYESELDINTPAKLGGTPYHIGCSGWFYWDWKGLFYPEAMATSEWFGYYAKQFDTVELNAPFYSWPTVATVKSWRRKAEKPFVYTVKVSELITHVKQFQGTKTLIKDFGFIADLLGEQMGCFLFQLPPSFHFSEARLSAIVEQLDPKRRNVVEFRHKSWWNEEVYEAFRENNIIFCSCSGPKLPDDVIKTADELYIRFHGTGKWYRHDYSSEELADWARRIIKAKAKKAWIYFNNDYDGFAIKNAKELLRLLEAK